MGSKAQDDFLKNICKSVGHTKSDAKGKCKRCGKQITIVLERIKLDTFDIVSKPKVPFKDITVTRYPMFERTREKAKEGLKEIDKDFEKVIEEITKDLDENSSSRDNPQ